MTSQTLISTTQRHLCNLGINLPAETIGKVLGAAHLLRMHDGNLTSLQLKYKMAAGVNLVPEAIDLMTVGWSRRLIYIFEKYPDKTLRVDDIAALLRAETNGRLGNKEDRINITKYVWQLSYNGHLSRRKLSRFNHYKLIKHVS